MNPPAAQNLSALAVQACLDAGVREFALCAGSRNSPLVREILRAAAALRLVRAYHFFEERCAGYFALGRVRKTERPVAVVTTSGTAAAELFPAIIEAHYQGLPLLALTADRPRRFRGSGAPQAIEQVRLFGDYPQRFADVADPAEIPQLQLGKSGPSHWNLCLEEPTSAVSQTKYELRGSELESPNNLLCNPEAAPNITAIENATAKKFFADGEDLLVLLGDLLPGERALALEWLGQWKSARVWAEAGSNLRGHGAISRPVLEGDTALRRLLPQRVLRIGGVPSCRFWRDLESHPEIPVLSLTRSGHSGLARPSEILPLPQIRPNGKAQPVIPESPAITELLERHPEAEPAWLRWLSRVLPEQSLVFLGNSLVIRQWNLAAAHRLDLDCRVLRGANGIDGNLSYFFGLAADSPESWAVVGDLTALYDLAAPWIEPQLPAGRRGIVVINNGGGKIFSNLPSLAHLTPAERSVIENHHALRLRGWAELWGWNYVRLDSRTTAAALPEDARCIVEIIPDPTASQRFWDDLAKLSP